MELMDPNTVKLVEDLNDEERCTVEDMYRLCKQTVLIDVELYTAIHRLEKSMESRYWNVYDQRVELLEKFGTVELPKFWLKVLQNSTLAEFISKQDEDILKHLKDIRYKIHLKPHSKFVINFYFESNEYFSDSVLKKTFYIQSLEDIDNILKFEGLDVVGTKGCKIKWTCNRDDLEEVSFFEFFGGPYLIEKSNTKKCKLSEAETKKLVLQNSLEMGIYIKDRIIPFAILYYTGEANEKND